MITVAPPGAELEKSAVPPLPVTLGDFFFQAEDGIRACKVTGVETCALPICKTRGNPGCARTAARTLPAAHGKSSWSYPRSGRRTHSCKRRPHHNRRIGAVARCFRRWRRDRKGKGSPQ